MFSFLAWIFVGSSRSPSFRGFQTKRQGQNKYRLPETPLGGKVIFLILVALVTELGSVTHPSPKLCFESVAGTVRVRITETSRAESGKMPLLLQRGTAYRPSAFGASTGRRTAVPSLTSPPRGVRISEPLKYFVRRNRCRQRIMGRFGEPSTGAFGAKQIPASKMGA